MAGTSVNTLDCYQALSVGPLRVVLQEWPHCTYAGQKFHVPEEIQDYSIQGKYGIPMNMHVGNMGLAPAVGAGVM